jgi:acyl carrier protein
MNIMLELEGHFDISIPLDRLASVETGGDLSNLVTDLRNRA